MWEEENQLSVQQTSKCFLLRKKKETRVWNYGFYFYAHDAIPAKKPKRPDGKKKPSLLIPLLAALFKGETGIPCNCLQPPPNYVVGFRVSQLTKKTLSNCLCSS